MQDLRRRGGLAFAGLLLSGGCWWAVVAGDSPLPATSPPPAPAAHTDATLFVTAPSPGEVPRPASRASTEIDPRPACSGQHLTLLRAGPTPEHQCMTPTSTQRSGETVIHEVQGSGGSQAWRLRIETIGRAAHRLILTNARGERYGCARDEGGCPGVAIKDGDAPAVRSIVLDNTPLTPLAPLRPRGMRAADWSPAAFSASPAATPIRLSAELSAQVDDGSESTCAGAALTLVSSHGKVSSFCADAGNEQGSLPGGGELVGFLAYAGPGLRVHLDGYRQISRVELGPLACEGSACTGAVVEDAAPTDPQGLRIVSFSGTTLVRTGAGGPAESVVVDGRLPLP